MFGDHDPTRRFVLTHVYAARRHTMELRDRYFARGLGVQDYLADRAMAREYARQVMESMGVKKDESPRLDVYVPTVGAFCGVG